MLTHAIALAGIALTAVSGLIATLMGLCVFCSAALLLRSELCMPASVRRCGYSEKSGWWLQARDGAQVAVILVESVCVGYSLIMMVWRDHKGKRYRVCLTPETVPAAQRRRLAVFLRWGFLAENTDQFDKNFPPDTGSMTVAIRRTHKVGGVDAGKDN